MAHRHSSSKDLDSQHRPSRVFLNLAPRSSTEATFQDCDLDVSHRLSDERFVNRQGDRFSNEVDDGTIPQQSLQAARHSGPQLEIDTGRPPSDANVSTPEVPLIVEPASDHTRRKTDLPDPQELPPLANVNHPFADFKLSPSQNAYRARRGGMQPLVPFTHRRFKSEPVNEPSMLVEKHRMMVKSLENEFLQRTRKSEALHQFEHEAFTQWAARLYRELNKLESIIFKASVGNASESGNLQVLNGLKLDLSFLRKQMDRQLELSTANSPDKPDWTTAPTSPQANEHSAPTVKTEEAPASKAAELLLTHGTLRAPSVRHHRTASGPAKTTIVQSGLPTIEKSDEAEQPPSGEIRSPISLSERPKRRPSTPRRTQSPMTLDLAKTKQFDLYLEESRKQITSCLLYGRTQSPAMSPHSAS